MVIAVHLTSKLKTVKCINAINSTDFPRICVSALSCWSRNQADILNDFFCQNLRKKALTLECPNRACNSV